MFVMIYSKPVREGERECKQRKMGRGDCSEMMRTNSNWPITMSRPVVQVAFSPLLELKVFLG